MKSKPLKCVDCRLSNWAPPSSNAAEGWGNPDARLIIVLDCPGSVLAEKLLIWIMKRLSLSSDDVWVDYNLKCPIPKFYKKKKDLQLCHRVCWTSHARAWAEREDTAIILMGNWSADFLGHAKMKDYHHIKTEDGAWVCYSPNYLLMNPAECVDTARVIYKAAEEVGLKPKMIVNFEAFRFPSKKIAGG